MKSEVFYKGGTDDLSLTIMATTDGLEIEAEMSGNGEDGSVSPGTEETKIPWVDLLEAMIRVAGKL